MILKDRNYKNKIGILLSYISMIISIVVGIIITPIILKSLGDQEYGVYILVASLVSCLYVIQNGFSDTIMRYIARFRAQNNFKKRDCFNGFALIINIVASIIIACIGILIIIKFPSLYAESLSNEEISTAIPLLYLMLFNIVIIFISNVFFGYLAAYEEFIVLRGTELVNQVLSNLMLVIVLLMGGKSFEIVLIMTVFNIIARLFEVIYCFKKNNIRFNFSFTMFEPEFFREVIFYFFAIFIVVVVEQIYWKLDNILIAGFLSTSAVAVYSIGMSFHKYFMKFSTAISKVMAPSFFIKLETGADKTKITEMLIKISRLQAIPIFLALSGFIMYGQEFISLWIGDSYSVAYYIALVTLIPYSFDLIGNLRNVILQAKNLYMQKSILILITSIFNIFLTIWWLKLFGIIGAALATGVGVMIGYIGVTIILKKNNLVDNMMYLKNTYITFFIPILCALLWGNGLKILIPCDTWLMLSIHIALYTIVYTALTVSVVLSKNEKQYLHNMLRRKKLLQNKEPLA